MSETTGLRIAPVTYTITHLDDYLDALHAHLDHAELSRAWAEGKAMTHDEAIEFGLSDMEARPSPAPVEESS
ncbi:MAG: hypothetical protein H0V47_12465 [Chloroflexia bacterium]|nr:hypothetical protein [Chloroflexia bacterium]